MQRRDFVKKSAALSALAILTPALLVEQGCTVNVQGLLNTVIDSAEAIIKVADPNATWLQPLENALVALQQAEAQWQGGSAVAILISALNTIEAVLAVIPATAVYSPLIAILVAGIEAVLTALIPPAPAQSSFSAKASADRANNPYINGAAKTTLHGRSVLHPTYQGAYKAQWNSTARKLKLEAACLN